MRATYRRVDMERTNGNRGGSPMESQQGVLTGQGLSKRYGGVQALDNVDVSLRLGTIVALAGQNGAGKSTLVKIISGAVNPIPARFGVDGRPIRFDSVQSAQQRGIRVVHQVPALALELNVLDNVYLGSERVRRARPIPLPWLDRRGMLAHLRPLLDRFAPDLDPYAVVGKLRAHERRLVGIIKALANDARVLILDEPTAALPSNERARLLETVRNLRDQGLAVLYVSHHLEEFEQLADEVVVLRDGRLVQPRDRQAERRAHRHPDAGPRAGRSLRDITADRSATLPSTPNASSSTSLRRAALSAPPRWRARSLRNQPPARSWC